MKSSEFLTVSQQERLISAIKAAEKCTSGEIRIHIDDKCTGNSIRRAEQVFRRLRMDKTRNRNGILIYIACESKVFAIIGDKGINDAVPEGFWNDVSSAMSESFRKGEFAAGLETAVKMTGEKLQKYFPYSPDDVNEQPDDISFGSDAASESKQ